MQRQNASKLQEFKTSGLRKRLRDACGWRERERGIGNRGQSVLGLLCLVCLSRSVGRSFGCASCTNYLIYQEYCKDHNRTDRVDNCGNVGEGGGGRGRGGRGGACEMHLQLQLLLHKRNSAALKPIKVRKVGQLHWRRTPEPTELPR